MGVERKRRIYEYGNTKDEQGRRNIVDRILNVWNRYPTKRLGELIDGLHRNLYIIEDYDLVETLEKVYLKEVVEKSESVNEARMNRNIKLNAVENIGYALELYPEERREQ